MEKKVFYKLIYGLILIAILLISCYEGNHFKISIPTIEITTPQNNEELSGTFQIKGTASGNKIAKIEVKVGNLDFAEASGNNEWNFTCDSNILYSGETYIFAKATDIFGGTSQIASVKIFITDNPKPPEVTVTSPATKSTAENTIKIEGTAKSDQEISEIQISIDGQTYTKAEGTTEWYYNLDTTTLTEGEHFILIVAVDVNGNKSEPQIITIIVDNNKNNPIIQIDSPDLTPSTGFDYPIFGGNNITLTGKLISNVNITSFQGRFAGQAYKNIPINGDDWTVNFEFKDSYGNEVKDKQLIVLKAIDSEGNLAQENFYILIDKEPPNSLNFTKPSWSDTQGKNFLSELTVEDNYIVSSVQVRINGTSSWYSATYDTDLNAWQYIFKNITDANVKIDARAFDSVGNECAMITLGNVNIADDSIAPTINHVNSPGPVMNKLCEQSTIYVKIDDNIKNSIEKVEIKINSTNTYEMKLELYSNMDPKSSIWKYQIDMNDGYTAIFDIVAYDYSGNHSGNLILPSTPSSYTIDDDLPCVTSKTISMPKDYYFFIGMNSQCSTDGTKIYTRARYSITNDYQLAVISLDNYSLTTFGDLYVNIKNPYYYDNNVYYLFEEFPYLNVMRYDLNEQKIYLVGKINISMFGGSVTSLTVFGDYIYINIYAMPINTGIYKMSRIGSNNTATKINIVNPANFNALGGIFVNSTDLWIGAVESLSSHSGLFEFDGNNKLDMRNGGPFGMNKDGDNTSPAQFYDSSGSSIVRIYPFAKMNNDIYLEGQHSEGFDYYTIFRKMDSQSPYEVKTIAGDSESTIDKNILERVDGTGGVLGETNSYARFQNSNEHGMSVIINNKIYHFEIDGLIAENRYIRIIDIPNGY